MDQSIFVSVVDGMTNHDSGDITRLETSFLSQEGIVNVTGSDFKVTAQASPDLTVKINKGACFVLRDSNVNADGTLKFWHVILSANIAELDIDTPDATNPRIDLVCVKIDTGVSPDANASNVGSVVVITGTPAGSPSRPSVPANHLEIAQIAVPALATTISNSNITDTRSFVGFALPINEGYRFRDTQGNVDGRFYEDSAGNMFIKSEKSGAEIKIDVTNNRILSKGKAGGSYVNIGGGYYDDSASTDAYAVNIPHVTAYTNDLTFRFKANTANTGGATINVNGLGAKAIVKNGSSGLATGDISAGQIVQVFYDGINFQLMSSGSSGGSSGSFDSCKVTKSGNQSTSNNSSTIVAFDQESFDTNSMHDNSTNNSRITIQTGKGGKYMIFAGLAWESNTTGVRGAAIKKNGSSYLANSEIQTVNGEQTVHTVSCLEDLAAGDYIEVEALQKSGGSLNITPNGFPGGGSFFSVLGPF